jgi:eukaryotic-like serine/threonine-protein kinase
MSISEPAKPDSLVGELIDGRYRISREIAVGGMGVVYEAKHAKIGRSVAIKVLHREMAGDTEVVGRFLNEARAMGTIGHPNIVACTDFGELPGHLPYLVLEYLEGKTLGDEIAGSGPFSVERALRVAGQVASALEAAHSRGVIHRDLTSGNVFLTKIDGDVDHVKVLDFGISKFLTATDITPKTRRGFTMGTPEFMSPEQITRPDVVDARVDVYALGVVLYHMLAGKVPFGAVAVQTLFLQVVNELPPHIERTDLPPQVLAMLDKALAKNPEDRFANMREMGQELGLLAPSPAPVTMIGGAYSGRVEAVPVGLPRTGSRPIPRSITAAQRIGDRSGGYPAAHRTSLVEMAAAKADGEQPAPPAVPGRSRKVLWGLVGLAGAGLVGWVLLGGGREALVRGGAGVAPHAAAPSAASTGTTAAPSGPVNLQVFSSAPSARVTFRGRAHQIPFAQQMVADTKLELVEVTAPGREGRRFWLMMDHSMQLTVDLAPGRGVIEATTEEAQIALGERLADPSAAAPTAGADPSDNKPAPSATASPSSSSSLSNSSHRSSARSKTVVASAAASASPATSAASGPDGKKASGPVAATPTTPAPSVDPPPSSLPPAASAAKAPEAVAAAAPPAHAPAPDPTAAPGPVSPRAQPAPPRAAPPTPAAGSAPAAMRSPVTGTIDSAKAQQVFGEHAVEVQRCHQRAKIDNSDIRGKLTIKIAIAASGQVTGASVEGSNLHNDALESCIANVVKSWPFPPPLGGPATLSHAFVLR